jgi:hypothetical protein
MERCCYSIERHHDRWSVSACGEKVLICDSKKLALKIVRLATDALYLERDGARHMARAENFSVPRRDEHVETELETAR